MAHLNGVVPNSPKCLSLRLGTTNAKNTYPNHDYGPHAQKDDIPPPNPCDLSQNDLRKTLRSTTRVDLSPKMPPTNKPPLESRLSRLAGRLAPPQTCPTPESKAPGTKTKGATRNQRRNDARRLNNQASSQGIILTAADVQDICAKRRRLLSTAQNPSPTSHTTQPTDPEPSEHFDSADNTRRLLGHNLDDDASVTDELTSRPSDSPPPPLSPPPTTDASPPPTLHPTHCTRTASPPPLLPSAPPTHPSDPLVYFTGDLRGLPMNRALSLARGSRYIPESLRPELHRVTQTTMLIPGISVLDAIHFALDTRSNAQGHKHAADPRMASAAALPAKCSPPPPRPTSTPTTITSTPTRTSLPDPGAALPRSPLVTSPPSTPRHTPALDTRSDQTPDTHSSSPTSATALTPRHSPSPPPFSPSPPITTLETSAYASLAPTTSRPRPPPCKLSWPTPLDTTPEVPT